MMSANPLLDDDETRAYFDRINSYAAFEVSSNYTASLYEDVSEGDFVENEEIHQEVNRLEREYFDSCHRPDAGVNDTFATSDVGVYGKILSEFECRHFHQDNVTPDRPCTAFFKSDNFLTSKDVFEALKTEGFASDHVRCLQRKPSGDIYITFKTPEIREAFLKTTKFASPRAPNKFFVPQDSERPLTYLTIYDAPYELSDDAIIHRLSPYCEVMWHRRGKFSGTAGAVFNGLRHYRICLEKPIPSYLRFGKFLLRLQYEGQTQTCRKCNRPHHKAADCKNTICFNCDGLGHEARECIRPMYCCLCKSGQHLARDCKFSWQNAGPRKASKPSRRGGVSMETEGERAEQPPPPEDESSEVSATAPEDPPVDMDDDGTVDEQESAEVSPPLVSPVLEVSQEVSQMTPSPGDSPAPEGDFTETVDSALSPSVSTAPPPTQEQPGPSVSKDGFIVENEQKAVATVPNTEMQPTPQSDVSSWADIVDRASPVVSSPKPQRGLQPQRSGPRRRIVPAPSLIPALTRKKTQPARVPTSKTVPQPRENSADNDDDMDTSTGSRKRKNQPSEDSGGGGKHSA